MLFQYCRCVEDAIKHLLDFPLPSSACTSQTGSGSVQEFPANALLCFTCKRPHERWKAQRHHGSTWGRKCHWAATDHWEQFL